MQVCGKVEDIMGWQEVTSKYWKLVLVNEELLGQLSVLATTGVIHVVYRYACILLLYISAHPLEGRNRIRPHECCVYVSAV